MLELVEHFNQVGIVLVVLAVAGEILGEDQLWPFFIFNNIIVWEVEV